MNLRTYEIIAKWVGKQFDLRVEFHPNVVPCAQLKTNTIKLPSNIKHENTYGALSVLMHEAAHLRYTKEIPDKLIKDELSHNILNVIEDIRIDRINFGFMPNIKDFYGLGMQAVLDARKSIDPKKISPFKKHMVNAICELEDLTEGCFPKLDRKLQNKTNDLVERGVGEIHAKDWDGLLITIDEIKKLFGLDKEPPIPRKSSGAGDGKLAPGKGNSRGGGVGGEDGDISKLIDRSGLFATSEDTDGTSASQIGTIALQDLTKQRFMDLLNIKETVLLSEGNRLNQRQLTSFFTGEVGQLFIREEVEYEKRSKILLLLDSSDSMRSALLDGVTCRAAVTGAVTELVKILKEVRDTEGANVDYGLAAFDDMYHPLRKENWAVEYSKYNGNTNLLHAFDRAHQDLLKNQSIDGKKLLIIFTDGCVSPSEIDSMKKTILAHGEDVRCMVIGIGADVTGYFVKEIVGDFNVLARECADVILLEAIMTML